MTKKFTLLTEKFPAPHVKNKIKFQAPHVKNKIKKKIKNKITSDVHMSAPHVHVARYFIFSRVS